MTFFKKKNTPTNDVYVGGSQSSWNKQFENPETEVTPTEAPPLPVWNAYGTPSTDATSVNRQLKKQSKQPSFLKRLGRKSKSSENFTGGIGEIDRFALTGNQMEEMNEFSSLNLKPQSYDPSEVALSSPTEDAPTESTPTDSNSSNIWFGSREPQITTKKTPLSENLVRSIQEILQVEGTRTTPDREQVELVVKAAATADAGSLAEVLNSGLTQDCSWQVQSKALYLVEALLKDPNISQDYIEYFRENCSEIAYLSMATKVSVQTKAVKICRTLGVKVPPNESSLDKPQAPPEQPSVNLLEQQDTLPTQQAIPSTPAPAPISGIFAGMNPYPQNSSDQGDMNVAVQSPKEQTNPYLAPSHDAGLFVGLQQQSQPNSSPNTADLFSGLSVSHTPTKKTEATNYNHPLLSSTDDSRSQVKNQDILSLFNAPVNPQPEQVQAQIQSNNNVQSGFSFI
mmetsp:Transcript_3231/g.4554  ORF Transcript_3231/g.4554 Transcript_3231/m.4554 type:complete len:454 (+) Transcript_3231:72-1433(+)|eukprot:CAMPEP_0117756392 /NCGR_PEP_ID=MMETSP0947-20121206/14051_1 /TAXON_ID=44440 /ORGANISM="Chattonella subsalsa, Strain CCMP2191" /LENGTH=453 /DNA_ID=CAMNT_0005575971 /DNA_START=215 /DNA_END=1576 /DNA_ORIENTATION=+